MSRRRDMPRSILFSSPVRCTAWRMICTRSLSQRRGQARQVRALAAAGEEVVSRAAGSAEEGGARSRAKRMRVGSKVRLIGIPDGLEGYPELHAKYKFQRCGGR